MKKMRWKSTLQQRRITGN